MVCHAQHLATNFQGQGHNFDSNFGKKSTFPEYGHVAYQIKWNEMYNSIQANISPLCAPSTPGVGSKDQNIFFLKMVMLHIKLKRMTCTTTCKQYFCPYTHSQPLVWGQNSFFLKTVVLHIKLKGMKCTITCKQIFCP